MARRTGYAKRGPVILPIECPREVLLMLAGNPLILTASDEQALRIKYAHFREAMRAAQERRRG